MHVFKGGGVLLAEYGAKIEYTSGSHNIRADMLSRIKPTYQVAVIDSNEWVDPHAFPTNALKILPLEHDGLDLEEIRKQQESEFVRERQWADSDDSEYTLINHVLYSIKRPQQTAPDYPRVIVTC